MTLINKVCFHGILKFSVSFLLTIFMPFWLVPALFLLSRVQWSTTLFNFVVNVGEPIIETLITHSGQWSAFDDL